MVFRKDRYPSNWKGIRAGVVLRANNRCEECMAPNGDVIAAAAFAPATPAVMSSMLEAPETCA
jgi:hypothetical protein